MICVSGIDLEISVFKGYLSSMTHFVCKIKQIRFFQLKHRRLIYISILNIPIIFFIVFLLLQAFHHFF
jgi:hypothetical protein